MAIDLNFVYFDPEFYTGVQTFEPLNAIIYLNHNLLEDG
jgi:hypothetical protein